MNDVILKYKQGNILPKKRKAEGSVGIVACLMEIVINALLTVYLSVLRTCLL